jgi:putative cell wall-binding protein
MTRRVLLVLLVVLTGAALPLAAAAAPPTGLTVVEDDDAVMLAVRLSRLGWDDGEASGAVLGPSQNFADALAAVPLAASLDGPTLVAPAEGPLPQAVAEELVRVVPAGGPVRVLGGSGAVSAQAEQDARELGFEVTRVFGPSRFDTAIEVARLLGAPAPLFLARADLPQDGFVAGTAAAEVGGAVLLAFGDDFYHSTEEYLNERGETVTVIAVGETAQREQVDTRYRGATEPATSVLVADAYFPQPATVVLAGRSDFVAQLAGGSLAARLDAPLLLTEESGLAPEVDELLRDGVRTVVLAGGAVPFEPIVARQVRAALDGRPAPTEDPSPSPSGDPSPSPSPIPEPGPLVRQPTEPVERLAGIGRLETAVATSRQLFADQTAHGVVLARADQFPDALTGAPLAVRRGGPLLLSANQELPQVTADEVTRVLPTGGTVTLLGGEAALGAPVVSALEERGYRTERVSGSNRFATAVAVATALGEPDPVLVASGNRFPDALGAGPAAAAIGGAVLLSADESLPPETAAYLDAHAEAQTYAVGGPAAAAIPSARPLVGADRYRTNIAVAEAFFPAPSVVGVATGLDFPDALSGGAAIAFLNGPMLLSDPARVPEPVRAYLEARGESVEHALLFGGVRALSEDLRSEIQGLVTG